MPLGGVAAGSGVEGGKRQSGSETDFHWQRHPPAQYRAVRDTEEGNAGLHDSIKTDARRRLAGIAFGFHDLGTSLRETAPWWLALSNPLLSLGLGFDDGSVERRGQILDGRLASSRLLRAPSRALLRGHGRPTRRGLRHHRVTARGRRIAAAAASTAAALARLDNAAVDEARPVRARCWWKIVGERHPRTARLQRGAVLDEVGFSRSTRPGQHCIGALDGDAEILDRETREGRNRQDGGG